MTTDKATRLLRKIQALYENLSDQGTMSSLERDLLLSYLRELYEEIAFSPAQGQSAVRKESPASFHEYHEPSTVKEQPPIKDKPVQNNGGWHEPEPYRHEVPRPPVPPQKADPPAPPATPIHQESPQRQPEPALPVMKKDTPVHRDETPWPAETAVSALNEELPVSKSTGETVQVEMDESMHALFSFKQIGELSEKLQLQPLTRLEQGMGINERILMINELFRGDGILFNQTLKDIDAMANFDEAKSYLAAGVANRFQWAEDNRKYQAAVFIRLVRRRFLGA